ncbi:MAG: gas vesicle protein GvpN [Verrucomicrobia bacterium]|nr:gas vesicle protein GvpN [Verrucomicrobiota bacterium]
MNATETTALGTTALRLEPRADFVSPPQLTEIAERAVGFLEAGYPVHFCGSAGTGKTTLALHLAAQFGRPVVLIHGDDEFGTSDLVGDNQGYNKRRVVDNYIHSVLKTEESMQRQWVDNRLTTACKHGFTLVYDEFTRSRPEANNALLSVLEEGILSVPDDHLDPYLKVHPSFRAIFTSNPEEYVGVHKMQDALLDRMVTLRIDQHNEGSETDIVESRAGMNRAAAQRVVRVVRVLREAMQNQRPSLRQTIRLARMTMLRGARPNAKDAEFRRLAHEILSYDNIKVTRGGKSMMSGKIDECIDQVCSRDLPRSRRGRTPPTAESGNVPANGKETKADETMQHNRLATAIQ